MKDLIEAPQRQQLIRYYRVELRGLTGHTFEAEAEPVPGKPSAPEAPAAEPAAAKAVAPRPHAPGLPSLAIGVG